MLLNFSTTDRQQNPRREYRRFGGNSSGVYGLQIGNITEGFDRSKAAGFGEIHEGTTFLLDIR